MVRDCKEILLACHAHTAHPVIQNNLQFVAASNLDPSTFQVSYQMKILTTAGFSVLLLRKKLSPSQWFALLFLAIGVGVVQIQTSGGGTAKAAVAAVTESLDVHSMNAIKGFLAVAAACFTSGLAGVYFEMVLKNSQADLWVRNVQLSAFSLLPALMPVLVSHQAGFSGMFNNFGGWAWATVLIKCIPAIKCIGLSCSLYNIQPNCFLCSSLLHHVQSKFLSYSSSLCGCLFKINIQKKFADLVRTWGTRIRI